MLKEELLGDGVSSVGANAAPERSGSDHQGEVRSVSQGFDAILPADIRLPFGEKKTRNKAERCRDRTPG
jgi:hypothetical protein